MKDEPRDHYGFTPPQDFSEQRAGLERILAASKARQAKLREIAGQDEQPVPPAISPQGIEEDATPEAIEEENAAASSEDCSPTPWLLPDGSLDPAYIAVKRPVWERGQGNDKDFWITSGYTISYRLRTDADGDEAMVFEDPGPKRKPEKIERSETQAEWRDNAKKHGTRDAGAHLTRGYQLGRGYTVNGLPASEAGDKPLSFTERMSMFTGWGR